MAEQIGTVEKDGFTGYVYRNPEKDTKFVAWQLASFSAGRGPSVPITGVTGEKGSPRAAAFNLDHAADQGYLCSILGARVQYNAGPNRSVDLSVPGASVHVSGFESPLKITLQASVGSSSRANIALALGVMANSLVKSVVRGVYAQTDEAKAPSADESEKENVEDIAF